MGSFGRLVSAFDGGWLEPLNYGLYYLHIDDNENKIYEKVHIDSIDRVPVIWNKFADDGKNTDTTIIPSNKPIYRDAIKVEYTDISMVNLTDVLHGLKVGKQHAVVLRIKIEDEDINHVFGNTTEFNNALAEPVNNDDKIQAFIKRLVEDPSNN